MILKRMKRRHLRADALAVAARARDLRPGIALGADLIAGFPTEDEEMFERTRALIDEAALDYLHVFPFSARRETPAARMPQLPGNLVRERARRLREAGDAALERALAARVGMAGQVLVERENFGRSEHYAPVKFDGAARPGEIVTLRLAASTPNELIGAAA
jgi:threonylcarbamoyladenosine tRNA methylthiotransferase MtaB